MAGVDGTELVLNGTGIRTVALGIKVYVGALYLPSRASSEGIASNNDAALVAKLSAEIAQFNAMFSDAKKGGSIIVDLIPGKGTSVTIDGEGHGTVPGDEFARAVLKIWLGPKPPTEALKDGMLGH